MSSADRFDENVEEGERLQKVLAHAGVASRRASEILITGGHVAVDGEIVRELGRRVRAGAKITVDGTPIQTDATMVYFALNKPAGVVSTMSDEKGRPDLSQYAIEAGTRIYNVGRLDTPTRGLLIMTNDGEAAHQLAHPSFGVEKTYLAMVAGTIQPATVSKLKTGIELEDGPINADRVVVKDRSNGRSLVEITLHSGRNRIVRRMLAAVEHPVIDLLRTQFGPIRLAGLQAGAMRPLTKVEVGELLREANKAAQTIGPAQQGQQGKKG